MVDHILTSVITAAQVAQREAEEGFAREIVGGHWVEEQELAGRLHGLIAIEILSPDEKPGHMIGKVADYLRFGTQQVWVIDPQEKNIAVYFPDGRVKVYEDDEILPGGEVLSGFELHVSEIFKA